MWNLIGKRAYWVRVLIESMGSWTSFSWLSMYWFTVGIFTMKELKSVVFSEFCELFSYTYYVVHLYLLPIWRNKSSRTEVLCEKMFLKFRKIHKKKKNIWDWLLLAKLTILLRCTKKILLSHGRNENFIQVDILIKEQPPEVFYKKRCS